MLARCQGTTSVSYTHLDVYKRQVYGQLKAGKTVTLPEGRIVNGHDFIGKAQKGRIVTFILDTRPNDNVEWLAKNADVLVHESTYGSSEEEMCIRDS